MIIVNTMIKVVFPSSSDSLSSSISDYDENSDMISKPFMSVFIVCMYGMFITNRIEVHSYGSHTRAHTHEHTHAHTRAHTFTHTRMHAHTHACTHTQTNKHTHYTCTNRYI